MQIAKDESEKCMYTECWNLGVYEITERCANQGKLLCQSHAETTNYLVERISR